MLAGVYLKEDTQKYTAGFTNRMCFTNRLKAMLFKCEKKSYTCIKKKFFILYIKWPCYAFLPFSEDGGILCFKITI